MLGKTVLLMAVIFITNRCGAQSMQTYQDLNLARITTNKTGMKVLGTWGVINIVTGVTGYAVPNNNEWRSFHQMNAIWGVV